MGHGHLGEPGLQAAGHALGQNRACCMMRPGRWSNVVQSEWNSQPDGAGGGPPVVSDEKSAG